MTVQPVKAAAADTRPVLRDTQGDVSDGGDSQELVLRIVRDAGTGLGMSVAGGVGTTAFKDGDEVTFCRVINIT